jgi:antirestriction protein ArdC
LVNINQFKNIGGYYSTLFHEIIHSTKNPKRLGRGGEKTKNLPYANEELVAEMGAMILCSELGLEYGRQTH